MIVIAFLRVIATTWRGVEIRMDVLVHMLPCGLQRVLRIFEQAGIAALCFWVAWLSWGYVQRIFGVGMLSDGTRLPVWIIHVMLPISFAALGLIACWRCLETIRGKDRVRGEELSL